MTSKKTDPALLKQLIFLVVGPALQYKDRALVLSFVFLTSAAVAVSVHVRRLGDVGCRRWSCPHESPHAGDEDEEPVERR